MTDICFFNPSYHKQKLAYVKHTASPAHAEGCYILFLTGFRSDMQGTKALFLEEWAKKTGRGFVRFDYRGHGQSEGNFEDLCISDWLEDATAILTHILSQKPVIIVGSSMGGWLGMLLARKFPDQIQGFIGLAAAPDMTHALMLETFDEATQEQLMRDGKIYQDCIYDPENPYVITKHLIEDGEQHLLLNQDAISLDLPIRLIHGCQDQDVPWQLSVHVGQAVVSEDVHVHLIKDGDHRLSREQDLEVLEDILSRLVTAIDTVNQTADDLIEQNAQ